MDVPAATPCPICQRRDRMVLTGRICFECERLVSREVASDMPRLYAYLRPRLMFIDWCIEHGCIERKRS